MKLSKLLTYSFDRNVGTADRLTRIALAVVIASLAWFIVMPASIRHAIAIIAAMIFFTGVVSRCGIYYLMGYGTCPLSGKRDSDSH